MSPTMTRSQSLRYLRREADRIGMMVSLRSVRRAASIVDKVLIVLAALSVVILGVEQQFNPMIFCALWLVEMVRVVQMRAAVIALLAVSVLKGRDQ